MAAGVVVDTSYLITLADSARPHHQTARRYWVHFTDQGIPIYLPTIVVSEFYHRQAIPPDILRSCVVLPFNWEDAVFSASLPFKEGKSGDENRDALKDDIKILAQAAVREAAYVITDDRKSFFRFGTMMQEKELGSFQSIKLEDGFDPAFFNEGQREFDMNDEEMNDSSN